MEKYNPYKPYVEDEEPEINNNIQSIESIDSMLEETSTNNETKNTTIDTNTTNTIDINTLDTNAFNVANTQNSNPFKQEPVFEEEPLNISAIGEESAKTKEQLDIDIQKELEAKFDEIFEYLMKQKAKSTTMYKKTRATNSSLFSLFYLTGKVI